MRIILSAIVLLILLTNGCQEPAPKYPSGGPYFYHYCNKYYLPFRPLDEITYDQMLQIQEQSGSYYVAYFDKEGRIAKLSYYDNGKFEFEDRYYYQDNIIRRELTYSNGRNSFGVIDKKGHYISAKQEH
ncbi:MAG: hypothetical protein KBB01_00310 [Candidatus Omnitrophica bacterium]|jgi:hypothetical protein|nr:hypothetical protein [Candidatus Omnitrophota bacterium]